MTRLEVQKLIIEHEKKGIFDEHVDPIDYSNCYPVDENFHYIKKGFFEKTKYFLENFFIVRPFTWYANKFVLKTKVYGRKNLKGIKKGIITCNHISKIECLSVIKAFKGRKVYITAADFNNQKGFLGEMMRATGLMPLSTNMQALKNFNIAIEKRLKKNKFILFYPEQAMWWHYRKPRPYKNGAYHYATKYNVPIIPVFITLTETNKLDKEGIKKDKFHVHILEPIYPKTELHNKDNIEYLKNKNSELTKNKYEEFYNKKLKYEVKNN